MMKRLLVLCLALSGCSLYWGGDDDDVCNGVAYPEGGASQPLRNPDTGVCDYGGGGGGGYYCCGDSCTDEGYGYGADVPARDWGACETYCDALDENSCISTTGCHAAYLDQGLDALVPYTTFLGCWATAPYSTSGIGTCIGLDAQGCSERDSCSMVYYGGPDDSIAQKFEQCVDEQYAGCGIDIGCPTGSHCEQQCETCDSMGCNDTCYPTCVPDQTCDSIDCGTGYQCVVACEDSPDSCWPTCVPVGNDPGQCTGTLTCNSAPPTCPANTTAGIANGCWTGFCIPNAACGGQDPGDCYATVTCGATPPSCPTGTLPGIVAGCYSGYCIPTYSCEVAACETLSTEAACSARWDCTPVYLGTDCTCTMTGGCTCQTETYERCESTVMPL